MVLRNSTKTGVADQYTAGGPGGVSGYPRAWSRSLSWVRTPPSAYSYKFVGTFSCAQIELRKARERELATLDEISTSSGIAEPYARYKIEGKNRGEKRTTPMTTAFVQKVESGCVWRKKHTHTLPACWGHAPIPRHARYRSITHILQIWVRRIGWSNRCSVYKFKFTLIFIFHKNKPLVYYKN